METNDCLEMRLKTFCLKNEKFAEDTFESRISGKCTYSTSRPSVEERENTSLVTNFAQMQVSSQGQTF